MSGLVLEWMFRAWVIGMALLIVLATTQFLPLRRLRQRHPGTWRELGEPTAFHFSMRVQRNLNRFFKGDGPSRLCDPVLMRWQRWQRTAGWLCLVLMAPLTVYIVWSVFSPRLAGTADQPPPAPLEVPEPISLLAVVVVLLWVVCGLALNAVLLRRLRHHHPELWRPLGEPTVFLNASMRNQMRMSRFLLSGRHRAAGDRVLSAYVWATRLLGLSTIGLFFL